jgi:hypothetical protein
MSSGRPSSSCPASAAAPADHGSLRGDPHRSQRLGRPGCPDCSSAADRGGRGRLPTRSNGGKKWPRLIGELRQQRIGQPQLLVEAPTPRRPQSGSLRTSPKASGWSASALPWTSASRSRVWKSYSPSSWPSAMISSSSSAVLLAVAKPNPVNRHFRPVIPRCWPCRTPTVGVHGGS